MKKGFTLIELLAVIVILAIIALIATPIVLNIIKNSKISSSERSAENYIDAVEQAIAHQKMTDTTFNPTSCTISMDNEQSKLTCDGEELKVEINGEYPKSGIITFSNGKIDQVTNIELGGYFINKTNNKLVATTKAIFYTICTAVKETTEGNVPTGLYNPGDKYTCKVNETDSYDFYVIGQNINDDAKIDLIMDKNICQDGSAATSVNTCTVAWDSSGSNSNGPRTALSVLNQATSNWTNIPNLNETYNDENNHYTNFELTGKARLLKYSEATKLGSSLYWSNGDGPRWLCDNFHYINNINIGGYWLMTSSTDSSNAYQTWQNCGITYDGMMAFSDGVMNMTSVGIRPVITLPKSLVK